MRVVTEWFGSGSDEHSNEAVGNTPGQDYPAHGCSCTVGGETRVRRTGTGRSVQRRLDRYSVK